MGFVQVPVKLFAADNGREPVEVEMLVDTGAIFTLVPRPILEQLGVRPSGTRKFQTIEGRPIERDVGVVLVEVQGQQPPGPVPVIFGEANDGAVLGVTALESMGLKVDPSAGALQRTDLLMLSASSGTLRGRAHKFGAHIDTDQIIPAKYLVTTDPKTLGEHVMENNDPEFAQRVQQGDFIVADVNFGCGSSREHAQISILGAGVSCVIAKSFARIFFRNAINQGLPVLECPEAADAIHAGDELDVDLATGTIRDLTTEEVFVAKPYEPFLLELLAAGGIIEYTKRKLAAAKG